MFIDKVVINVRSGKGGDGAISFHREKYVPDGGPNGGDGGKGGDVIIEASEAVNTLGAFRYKRRFAAQDGEGGGKKNCSGKNADDLVIQVPIGTVIFDNDSGRLLCDMTEDNQRFTALSGGRGGRGNQHFATSTRQAPAFAKPGDVAKELNLLLELKTIADVGLIGFPNVGKSTLLSRVTNAKPKIANYHFTTLSPNLGIVQYKNAPEFVLADIPGLIEGASEGMGLGHDFLRHIERTRMLVHVIDAASSEDRDPKEDFEIINNELFSYSEKLRERPQVVALNKIDLMNDADAQELKAYFEQKGLMAFPISAATGKGLEALLDYIVKLLPETEKSPSFFTPEEIILHTPTRTNVFEIKNENGVYHVVGDMMQRILGTVNLDDFESAAYFQRVLKNKGIFSALEKAGIQDGDTVDICGLQFEYYR